jgi:hypothetical protein
MSSIDGLVTRAARLTAAVALLVTVIVPASADAQSRSSGTVGLTVYTDPGFRGESATLRDDIADLRSVRLNDEITSLVAGRGEMWEVCENTGFTGRCHVVSGEDADLRRVGWNDKISSARRLRGGRGAGSSGVGNRGGRIELFSGTGTVAPVGPLTRRYPTSGTLVSTTRR